jgi:hypothetical protein
MTDSGVMVRQPAQIFRRTAGLVWLAVIGNLARSPLRSGLSVVCVIVKCV